MTAPYYKHAIKALRVEARRSTTNADDLSFLLGHIANLEEWLDELRAVERRTADAINATGLRPCRHQKRAL